MGEIAHFPRLARITIRVIPLGRLEVCVANGVPLRLRRKLQHAERIRALETR